MISVGYARIDFATNHAEACKQSGVFIYSADYTTTIIGRCFFQVLEGGYLRDLPLCSNQSSSLKQEHTMCTHKLSHASVTCFSNSRMINSITSTE